MPEHLKALVVILGVSTVVFSFAKAPACALASTTGDFERRRNLWFAITLTAFLAHDFWIYIVVAAVLLFFATGREPNKLAMFFFLLFAVPYISAEIPSIGVIQNFFAIHYGRLLALVVLLPAFLVLRRQPDVERFGRTVPDKLLLGYLILTFILQLTNNTFTSTLRHQVFYAFTDVFLPYYVASRSLKNLQGFRDALMAFVTGVLVLSALGAFEFAKHWLLYSNLDEALGVRWSLGGYAGSGRGDSLRALVTTGQPIVLGYVIAVGVGFWLYLRKSVPNPKVWGLGMLLLIVGLIAPLSRGPWVGAALIFLVFVVTGPSAGLRFAKLGLLGIVALPLLLTTPAGQTIIDHLPFVGTIDQHNITYRQRVLDVCIQVILQNPFFGSRHFIHLPEIQDLRQGEGIVDIVNTYLGIGLWSGLVGLSLFAGFFVTIAIGIFRGMRDVADRSDESYLLGQILFATLLGILIMIFNTASITYVPVVYWSVTGLGVAYVRMLARAKVPEGARPAGLQAATVKLRT